MSGKPSELKPCPFCGGSVRIAEIGDRMRGKVWFVTRGDGCNCRVFMESGPFTEETKDERRKELIEAWNRRATDAAPVKHGEWRTIHNASNAVFAFQHTCSVCSRPSIIKSLYCPNCGAKMEVDG